MKNFQNSTFWLFLIEEINIYQMFLVPSKKLFLAEVITGWRSGLQCNLYYTYDFQLRAMKIDLKNLSSPTVFEESS